MKILEVMTEHTVPFKTLIEVLKELLPETNVEFLADDNVNNTEDISEGESEEEDDESAESGELDSEEELVESSDEELDSDNSDEMGKAKSKKKVSKSSTVQKSKGGIRIMAVDSTKTVLVNMKLDAENFTKFTCRKKKLMLGMNLQVFHKLIKSIDKDDQLTLYVDLDNTNSLKIKVENKEEDKNTVLEMKLLDSDEEPITVPAISFDAHVTMNSAEFHKMCREMSSIADHMEIKCSSNKIIFACKGESANRTTTYRTGDGLGNKKVSIQLGKTKDALIIQGIYELKNLVLFSKCANLSTDIEIFMKNNYPLVIKYTVATLGRVLLCLSPLNDNSIKNAEFSDDDEYYSDEDVELLTKYKATK
jgi:proliferating cell nuclear antigen PCNA